MKILLISLFCFQAMGECDFSTIEKKDNVYIYSKDCHLKVGELYKEEKLRQEQVKELKKSIELKDLALTVADTRVMKWRDESYKQNEALNKAASASKLNDWAFFGLGIVVSGFAVWGAGQLTK
jgi:hypothetical protein